MVALQNGSIVTIPLEEAVGSLKLVSPEFLGRCKEFLCVKLDSFEIPKF